MLRALKYFLAVAAIASIAPFMLPDGQGGRLFSWGDLALPELDLPWGEALGPLEPHSPAPRHAFKWRDSDGHVHFGDQPPPGVEAEPVVLRPGLNVVPAPAPEPPADDADAGGDWANPLRQARDAAAASEQRRQRLDRAVGNDSSGR